MAAIISVVGIFQGFGQRYCCWEISDNELVFCTSAHGCNLLEFKVLEQRITFRFEFEEVLDFCECLSCKLDVLLGNLTGTLVFEDCSISVGFGLNLQDGGLGSKSDVICSCLSFVDSPKCFIQDHLLFGDLSCNDCSLVDIGEINFHQIKVQNVCMSTF